MAESILYLFSCGHIVCDRDIGFNFYTRSTFNIYMLISNTYIFHPISKLTSNYTQRKKLSTP